MSVAATEDKKELAAARKRVEELDELIRGLYEANVSGKLPDRQYQRLMNQYDEEQYGLEKRIEELTESIEAATPKRLELDRFFNLIRKYQDFSELTDPMLYEFIEKVEVFEEFDGFGEFSICPESGAWSPANVHSNVLLPDPLRPSRQMNWPQESSASIALTMGAELLYPMLRA